MKSVVRPVVAVAASLGVLVLGAGPAGATTVLADDQFKWFYWIGPLLGLSFLGLLGALAGGYYVRVVRPRMRGRRVS